MKNIFISFTVSVFTMNMTEDDSNIDISLKKNKFKAIFYNQQRRLRIEMNC